MNIQFEKEKEGTFNKLFLELMFEGGDADTEHPEEYELEFTSENWKEHQDEIEDILKDYLVLMEARDEDDYHSYSKMEKKYGTAISKLWDMIPNDPQTDFDTKCYLSSISLYYIDETGAKWTAKIK